MGFLEVREECFYFFFRLKPSKCFSVGTHLFERSVIFWNFVCKHRLLTYLCVHMLALLVSVNMSWRAKTSFKLNMSRLDFIVLVLQSSNSFDLNAFFNFSSVYFCLVFKSYSIVELRDCVSHWVFWKFEKNVFVLFFRLKPWKCFPVETHLFERFFIFCTFVCNQGLWTCACTW